MQFSRSDLAAILRDGVAQASERTPSVSMEIHAPQSLPAVVDAGALAGLVRILVDTACRRTDPGLSVTIKANRADEGIAVHVFERGTGVDREQTHLDLARGLVALHGGILWSEPLPAGGVKTSFVIPRDPPALEGSEREAAIDSLDLLARLDAATAPVAQPEDQERDDAIVEVGLLDYALDEPQAILDVTDIPADSVVEVDATATPSLGSDPLRNHVTMPAEPEPLVDPGSAPEAEAAGTEPAQPEPESAGVSPAPEEDAPLTSRRKRRRSRWAWRRPPRPLNLPEPEPSAGAAPGSETISDPRISRPDPLVEAGLADPESAPAPADFEEEQPDRADAAEEAPPRVEERPALIERAEDTVTMPPIQVPDPSAGAENTGRRIHEARVPFVPDPLHPATQMLRALLVDEEQRSL